MNEELTKFETDREEQLRVMKERHVREMSSFDNSPPSSIGSSNVIANNCKSGSQFTSSPSGSHSSYTQFKSTGTQI